MPETKIVISDTSCLVVLDKIDELNLLRKVYTEVITTPEVQAEFKNPVPDWIKIQSPKDLKLQQELEVKVDKGEASALALGVEISNCIIILDDLKARKVAESLHLHFTGTLGLLVKAKELRVITQVKPLIDKLKGIGLRFSPEVEQEILKQSGE
jgi:predicted nucleic acid-binding protein